MILDKQNIKDTTSHENWIQILKAYFAEIPSKQGTMRPIWFQEREE
jgi:hypothetical protein